MSDSGKLTVTTPSGCEIAFIREFEAPRELVFEALTRPELVQRWMLGPPGWTMPVCEIDLRAGGAYRYVWRHEDGREMGAGGVYLEVVRPEKLVHTERFDEAWYPGESIITTTFAEKDGRTTFTGIVRYESKEARDGVMKSGMEGGAAMSYDRLAGVLASMR